MTRLRVVAGLAGVTLAASAAAGAQAAVERFALNGTLATASYLVVDGDGCTTTEVTVHAYDGLVRETGPKTPFSNADVSILRTSGCDGEDKILVNGSGSQDLALGNFVADKQLRWATLVAGIGLKDKICRCTIPLRINMRWTGTGLAFGGFSITRDTSLNGSHLIKYAGQTHEATAVGTVSDLTGTRTFASGASDGAALQATTDGRITRTSP